MSQQTCSICGQEMNAYQFAHHEYWHLKQELGSVLKKPLLGQDAQEAQRILYAGRKTELSREPKIFDDTTLERMPLFEKARKQGRLL